MGEASPAPAWLSIIGIGEDGVAGLSGAAQERLRAAEVVFGGTRHLALALPLLRGEARAWPSPFSLDPVLAERGRAVAVLSSGDPMWHGVGASLSRLVDSAECMVFPAPSAFALAAAHLGWPLAEAATVSLHGRAIAGIRPYLHGGQRVLALTNDGAAPAAIAALLRGDGFGASRIAVLEALGGPAQRVRHSTAEAFAWNDIHPLNLLGIEVRATPHARILARAPGLPDVMFEHDGQLTKREVRAITLSSLRPLRGALLWDVGAGAGSIGIEWMLADPSCRAIAIEERPDRAARIGRNAENLGVPGLRIVEGAAPQRFDGLPAPDAIFLGGGATDPGVLDSALAALRPGGRFVANAVTLETEALLLERHARLGGDMLRLAVQRAVPVAGMTGWRAAMPVTQWAWDKP